MHFWIERLETNAKLGVQSDGLEGVASLICNRNGLSESNPGGHCMTVVDVHDSRCEGEEMDLQRGRTRFPLHAVPRACMTRDLNNGTRYHVQNCLLTDCLN